MSWTPTVKLSVLRDIGWDHWDPIRLNGSEGGWRRSNAGDEYDRYLCVWRAACNAVSRTMPSSITLSASKRGTWG